MDESKQKEVNGKQNQVLMPDGTPLERAAIIQKFNEEQALVSKLLDKIAHDDGAIEQLMRTRMTEDSDMNIGNRVTEICLQLTALAGDLKSLCLLVSNHSMMICDNEIKLFDTKSEDDEDHFFITQDRDSIVKSIMSDEERLNEVETSTGKLTTALDVIKKLMDDWKPLIDILKHDYADILGKSGQFDKGT